MGLAHGATQGEAAGRRKQRYQKRKHEERQGLMETQVQAAAHDGPCGKQDDHTGHQGLLDRLRTLPGVTEVRPLEPAGADLYADRGGALISDIVNQSSAAGVELSDVHISEPSLENLFLHHTGRSLRE